MFKQIKKQYNYEFSISEQGTYMISVEAICKEGRVLGLFGGEDLRMEIDNIKLREIPAKGRAEHFNIPPAWNGTKLKGKAKIIIFILKLDKGRHNIKFIPNKGAAINKEPEIKPFETNIILENIQSEERSRQPWITIALIDLSLNILDVSATCEKRKTDSDDIKLVIDGQIQKNKQSNWWGKNWYFSGRQLQGQTKEARFYPDLPQGIHYLEFWADRTPVLNSVKLVLDTEGGQAKEKKREIKAKVVWDLAVLREAPEQNKQNVLLEIKKRRSVSILEKAIKGARPSNSAGKPLFSDRWHKVEIDNKTGYIYSESLEIEGEDTEAIEEFIIKKAREKGEDECLMLAVARRESRLFPYMVSGADAQGIFQLRGIAVNHVNEEFGTDFSDSFDIAQNIEAGILYFQIIKRKYQGTDYFLEKCLAGWNRGMARMNIGKFIMNSQPLETQQFIQDVLEYKASCELKAENSGKVPILALMVVGFCVLTAALLFLPEKRFVLPNEYKDFLILSENDLDIDMDGKDERIMVVSDVPTKFTSGLTKILFFRKNGKFLLELPGNGTELQWYRTNDFNKNGKMEIAVLYGYSGSAGFGQFYLYEWNNNSLSTLISRDEINGKAEFNDLNDDRTEEVVFDYRREKWGKDERDVYKWSQQNNNYYKM